LPRLSQWEKLLVEDFRHQEEVLDAAVQHAVSAHEHENSAGLRKEIRSLLKDESD
jgi:protein-arginine kinase activator protein McsA